MTLQGVDLSNFQGGPDSYRNQSWYRSAEFVIAQAIPRPAPDGYTGAQLRGALEDGKHRGIYTWLWHTPSWRMDQSVANDQRMRLATVPDDVPLDMRVFLDIEDNQSASWDQVSVQQRINDVNEALAVLDEWSAGRGLPEAGIYWSKWFIDLLFGGVDYFNRPQWLAHYGITPGSLIGGSVIGHQYTSTPVDMNIFLDSEVVTQSEPEEPPVDQAECDWGWQSKKSLVVGLAGELKAVADQIEAAAKRKYGPVRGEVLPLADAVRQRAERILS